MLKRHVMSVHENLRYSCDRRASTFLSAWKFSELDSKIFQSLIPDLSKVSWAISTAGFQAGFHFCIYLDLHGIFYELDSEYFPIWIRKFSEPEFVNFPRLIPKTFQVSWAISVGESMIAKPLQVFLTWDPGIFHISCVISKDEFQDSLSQLLIFSCSNCNFPSRLLRNEQSRFLELSQLEIIL
jgi:hypothetical protein